MRIGETMSEADWQAIASRAAGALVLIVGVLLAASLCGASTPPDHLVPSIFDPHSTPAESIHHLSHFVLGITGLIFLVVFCLLSYVVVRFRGRVAGSEREPAQVYGSTQIELAWTVIPILIVVVLFLATARVIHGIQDAPRPAGAMEVTAIGHQFWWEFRYPALGIVTANELHIPLSYPTHPTPTFVKLLSADTDHSFWVPQLAGKTDLIPNRVNETWLDPHVTGTFLGQCAQYCGTPTTGSFGPDLTHLMSRRTIAAGAAENTADNLRLWIQNPDAIKPGSLMPAMKLNDAELDALVRYMETLR